MTPGDDLQRHIRGYVRGRVHPGYEDLVVEMVARTVVLIMTTPDFYNHLTFVQELQLENHNLRQALLALQRSKPVKKTTAKKASTVKRPTVKKAVKKTPSKKPSNVKAFERGLRGY